jgi:hypothetical protein
MAHVEKFRNTLSYDLAVAINGKIIKRRPMMLNDCNRGRIVRLTQIKPNAETPLL